jgi:hypothetical protein
LAPSGVRGGQIGKDEKVDQVSKATGDEGHHEECDDGAVLDRLDEDTVTRGLERTLLLWISHNYRFYP